MPSFRVTRQLNFINCDKLKTTIQRHRFDCADKIGCMGRSDFLFARHERDIRSAFVLYNAIVNFTRKEA